MSEAPFLDLLRRGIAAGGFPSDDLMAAALPLLRQIAAWHESDLVVPWNGLSGLVVDEAGGLRFDATGVPPRLQADRIAALQKPVASALRVVGRAQVTMDDETGSEARDLAVASPGDALQQPAFITGYGAWELECGHHDELTDVFCAGQLLASLALGLDFTDADDLGRFARHQDNPFALNPRLHPVIAAVIVEMTRLNRQERAPELASLVQRLETYREQPVDMNVSRLPGFGEAGLAGRRRLVQAHLRERLFEISRRNRLLYFRPSQASLNLTVASVPLVLNLASIRLDQLFVWHDALAAEIVAGGALNLGRWLRFEDQPYLPAALDRLIADARRDRAEYGFAQLRLVVAFLHWHNLKEEPGERLVTPLLLLPVELTKKKGVRDQYVLDPVSSEAEVNPVLRHQLRALYGLTLPERIDLQEVALADFHRELAAQIAASEPGVTLRLVDKPEIRLIHERARQRLAQFQRRQKLSRPAPRAKSAYDYGYGRDHFRPLGLQLFRDKVLSAPLPQRAAAGGIPLAPPPQMLASAAETARETFALQTERAANPYAWDFDLCSITLGNFNYRKMSLVRDYGALIEGDLASESFDRVFSLDARPLEAEETPQRPPADQWPVVPGDATQTAAIALAATGRSFIIQGPPGTGKSQTITNLIADFVARGRRVLFVCEKRAAIDVVFHRLRQQGLDELCCLIHDSQTDKKSFVLNLKQTYEDWLAKADGEAEARGSRESLLRQMEQDRRAIERFDQAMRAEPDGVGRPVRQLLHRMVELKACDPDLTDGEAEALPAYALWDAHAGLARRLALALREATDAASFAAHPFSRLAGAVIRAERPLETLARLTDRAESLLDEVEAVLDECAIPADDRATLADVEAVVALAGELSGLAARGHIALLDPQSGPSRRFAECEAGLRRAEEACRLAAEAAAGWREQLPRGDTPAALEQARALEGSPLRFLRPAWWRLKKAVASRYDFSRHAIRPALSRVIADLAACHEAQDQRDALQRQAAEAFGVPAETLLESLARLRAPDLAPRAARALRDRLAAAPEDAGIVPRLAGLNARLLDLNVTLLELLRDFRRCDLPGLGATVRDLREEGDALADLLPLLTEVADAPDAFADALRRFALSPDALESACARRSFEAFCRVERWLPRFDGRVLAHRAGRIDELRRECMTLNAAVIRAAIRRRFREHVQLSTMSVTQLDDAGRAFKKAYAAGRRELEHEFGKTMRYKSIRDLAAGDTGMVVRDLKPVWLMSPLSVSDTLPLAADLFDVVIFDEASQVPVEEAVPAIYRAPQVIVVGDEMQLPPTTFFTAARDTEDETVELEHGGDRVAVTLDADSLLAQSARNLPATLLAWHYRSRFESLISFSNAAFYAGQLFTIPDRAIPASGAPELVVRDPAQAAEGVDALLARSISYHVMAASPYDDRRNPGEAAYIAQLIRELLRRDTRKSLGVVAFSEAQQDEIESALDALAATDPDFATRLEAEYDREENDQFCGLFVKNLENVQGDERDIILLSICYGPDAAGRMMMNFGPINQRGGEKRLNVIFSRARHHMAVVSSIRHTAITNDYNTGAAALKAYLRFAELVSAGDFAAARIVLDGLNPMAHRKTADTAAKDAVVLQLAAALRERGLAVDTGVGQSRFRCDLAIRAAGDDHYAAGILVDTAARYGNPDVIERYVTQPGVLRAFAWQVVLVLTRDWYHNPASVLDRITRALSGQAEPQPELEDEPAPPPGPAGDAPVREAPGADTAGENAGAFQRLEFVGGNSSKFWEIRRDGGTITVRYGRIGTRGQVQTKSFPTEERAAREAEKLAAEKLRKGYRDVS